MNRNKKINNYFFTFGIKIGWIPEIINEFSWLFPSLIVDIDLYLFYNKFIQLVFIIKI